jgi:flagellar basal body-associated protein FliL
MSDSIDNEPCCENNNAGYSCACSSDDNNAKKPGMRKTAKIVISLAVLLAVISIVSYRIIGSNNKKNNNANTNFILGQSSSNAATTGKITQTEQNLGEYLESLNELNNVAMSNDSVFVYIPDSGNVLIDDKSKTVIHEVQRYLERSKITIGLYTLSHDSPDYPELAKQFKLPAILIANKGAGAVVVPAGNVDEYTLLNAFQACCDPSSGCCQ